MLLAPAVAAANLTNCTPVVTACCKDDGFGAHYFAMIRIFSYSVAKQIAYCTSPWGDQGRMNHHADATQMWEFIGGDFLGDDCSTLPIGEGKYCEPTQYLAGPGAEVTEEAFTTARLKLLAAYHSTPKPYLWETDARHLAVHVRRGDVTEEKYGNTDRWVSNQDVAECIERAYIEMGGVDVEVHIFSEGHVDDFPELKELQPEGHPTFTPTFHLNTPANHLTDMFNRFVSADGFLLGALSRDRPRGHIALILASQTDVYAPLMDTQAQARSRGRLLICGGGRTSTRSSTALESGCLRVRRQQTSAAGVKPRGVEHAVRTGRVKSRAG
jgi:hypothetical protein